MTLYDILPPIIFFASLGGIILVASRIVLRIRGTQVRARVAAQRKAEARADEKTSPFDDDPTMMLKPNKKGIQVVGSRLGLMRSATQTAVKAVVAWRPQIRIPTVKLRRRKQRKENTAITHQQKPKQETSITAPQTKKGKKIERRSVSYIRKTTGALTAAQTVVKSSLGTLGAITAKTMSRVKRSRKKKVTAAQQPTVNTQQQPEQPKIHLEKKKEEAPPTAQQIKRLHTTLRSRLTQRKKPSLIEQAQEAFEAAKYQHVEEVLVPYLAKHPKNTEGYMLLGRVAMERAAWDEAYEILEQVMSLNPEHPGAAKALGSVALKNGRLTKAFEAFQHAHETDPTDKEVLVQLVELAHRMDNSALQSAFQTALDELKKREQAEPTTLAEEVRPIQQGQARQRASLRK